MKNNVVRLICSVCFCLSCLNFSFAQNLSSTKLLGGSVPLVVEVSPDNSYFVGTYANYDEDYIPDQQFPKVFFEQKRDAFVSKFSADSKYQWTVWFKSADVMGLQLFPDQTGCVVLLRYLGNDDTLDIRQSDGSWVQHFTGKNGKAHNGTSLFRINMKGEIISQWQIDPYYWESNNLYAFKDNGNIVLNIPFAHPIKFAAASDSIYPEEMKLGFCRVTLSPGTFHQEAFVQLPYFSSMMNTGRTYANTFLISQIQYRGDTASKTDGRLYFNFLNGVYKDSLIVGSNINIENSICFSDTLYLLTIEPNFGKTCTINNHVINSDGSKVWTKWVKGELMDSIHFLSRFNAELIASDAGKKFVHFTYTAENEESVFKNVKFFNGRLRYKSGNWFECWGPVSGDSLEWISFLEATQNTNGALGPLDNLRIYGDQQYLTRKPVHYVDFDPGPYEWKYNPSTTVGIVLAKYNCKPNAIFTFTQIDQRVDFINYSSGSDSFIWDFGFSGGSSKVLNPVAHYPHVGEYTVKLIAFNQCGSDTFEFPVTIDKISNVKKTHDWSSVFRVYPNPANDRINISGPNVDYTISLCTTSDGSVVRMLKVRRNGELEIGEIPSGLYVVVIESELGRVSKLVQIRH
ncbi:MAG: T9SS type A sorting domain-containing protein [Bacteroidetes bacterium]|nr:T9SS type A sorting domain-containing protein [Bacteroidota bacterium]